MAESSSPLEQDSAAVLADAASSRRTVHPHALRKLWLNAHLYVGLILGGLFVLLSLTGSILVFYKAIDEWLNPEQVTATGQGPYRPLGEIPAAVRAAHPEWTGPDSLRLPEHERDTFLAWYTLPTGAPDKFRWIEVRVDPYTAEVRSSGREWGGTFVSFIYELHESLLLDELGETIVGFVAVFLLLSVGTGLYLWWPRRGRVRKAFTMTPGESAIRRHYNLHKLGGLSSAVVLFILAFTGVYLAFPDYVIALVRLFSPVQDAPKDLRVEPIAAADPISVERAVAVAREVFPDAELKWIGFPDRDRHTGLYQVALRQPGEVRITGGQSHVWINAWTGDVVRVRDWRRFTAGETFIAWLVPLHNGEALGLIGRWIVCVAGFAPLLLYVTALRMWWLKRRARLRQKRRPVHQSSQTDSVSDSAPI